MAVGKGQRGYFVSAIQSNFPLIMKGERKKTEMLEALSIFHFPRTHFTAHFRLHYLSLFKLQAQKAEGGVAVRQSKIQNRRPKLKANKSRAKNEQSCKCGKAVFLEHAAQEINKTFA